MRDIIVKRLHSLQEQIHVLQLQAFIIPTSDPHMSEYTAAHWEFRKWISGFTGSAGTIVILEDKAALWTDSRYFIQAAQQLEGTGIELMKEKIPGTPTIKEYLSNNRIKDVGIDCTLLSHSQVEIWRKDFNIVDCPEITDKIWSDRPLLPDSCVHIYEEKYAGASSELKISILRDKIKGLHADGIFLSALDEIAWVLNIRGKDIHCNPVVVCFLLITTDRIRLFIDSEKLTEEGTQYIHSLGADIYPYEQAYLQNAFMHSLRIIADPDRTNDALYRSISSPINDKSPVPALKAVRNRQEIEGIHHAMHRDGIAMVRFLKWLEEASSTLKESELSASHKLYEFRAAQPLFMGESFDTIAGYQEHGAIVHYSASQETNSIIQPKGFLLLDSGAQYLDGTTDITRTIALGDLTDDEKHDYTLILKGHIDLALSVFPVGTTGGQLDALARMPIWKEHKNFLHGTGHGVGHYLCVHEGPQSIRMEQNTTPLLSGMVTSNEPGLYIEDKYGIRTENLMLTCDAGEGMFGKYLCFETLTLCPISTEPIIKSLLTEEEINWLNNYHQRVYEQLADDLSHEEQIWLKKATAEI
jgi:Xaa-Pro aminopeptidase